MNKGGGYLKVILGSMFAGKTSELIKVYNNYDVMGIKPLVINHSSDTRYSKNKLVTHDGVSIDSIFTTTLMSIIEKYIETHEIFLINEGQFFEDLVECVKYLVNIKNKKVYVCGLDGDYKREKFGQILDIIPFCDDVIKLKAMCNSCDSEGLFTIRLLDKTKNTEQVLIGDTDLYNSGCRKCYEKYNSLNH